MRVAMVRSKSPAGIEPRVDREASALTGAGYEVHILLWDRTLEHQREEKRTGFTIHRYQLRAPESQIGLLARIFRWWIWEFRTLFQLKPDIVHSCDFDTAIPAAAYAALRSKCFVYDIFDFYAYMIAQPLGQRVREQLARLERFVAQRADLVIIADKSRAGQLGEGFPVRLEEILNVPKAVEISEPQEKDFTVFYGGMITEERGLRQLVEATAMAGVKFVVAGHGGDEAALAPIFRENKHVRFLGNIPYAEVLGWTAKSQLIAAMYDPRIPNNRFASPNKLFEAMMLSRPVVANEGTRPAEIVREVGCGVVVNYENVSELADALRRLAADGELRREMGAKGRKAFEDRYNWPAMERRLVGAYSSL